MKNRFTLVSRNGINTLNVGDKVVLNVHGFSISVRLPEGLAYIPAFAESRLPNTELRPDGLGNFPSTVMATVTGEGYTKHAGRNVRAVAISMDGMDTVLEGMQKSMPTIDLTELNFADPDVSMLRGKLSRGEVAF